jgi:hypothetical protein
MKAGYENACWGFEEGEGEIERESEWEKRNEGEVLVEPGIKT